MHIRQKTKKTKNAKKANEFKCELCEAYFNSKRYFVEHLRSHGNPDLYKCNECLQKFSTSTNLRRHQINQHNSGPSVQNSDVKKEDEALKGHSDPDKKFTCGICEADFQDSLDYIEHLTEHNIFKCNECSKQFSSKMSLRRHQLIHKADVRKSMNEFKIRKHKPKSFICTICKIGLSTRSLFNVHLRIHENPDLFKCNICSKQLSGRWNLIMHQRRHNKPEVQKNRLERNKEISEKFNCGICKAVFNRKYSFMEHLKMHVNPELFKCKVCSIVFSNRRDLQNHRIKHNPGAIKFCPICNKPFKRVTSLNNHMIIHSKLYCQYCYKKQPPYEDSLKKHEEWCRSQQRKTFDSEENEPEHILPDCDEIEEAPVIKKEESFDQYLPSVDCDEPMVNLSRSYNQSFVKCEEELTLPADENMEANKDQIPNMGELKSEVTELNSDQTPVTKKFSCNICLLDFKKELQFGRHMKLHIKPEIYNCTTCSMDFDSGRSLRQHNKLIHTIKPGELECPVCKQQFSREKMMMLHLKLHSYPDLECQFCRQKFKENRYLKPHEKRCSIKHTLTHDNKNNVLKVNLEEAEECVDDNAKEALQHS